MVTRKTTDMIVLHTAADNRGGKATDTTAADIDQWHREFGWDGIGYHYVIRFNGAIETGRPETAQGAHAKGFNSRSVGICWSGHGDIEPPTIEQWNAALNLVRELMDRYRVPLDNVVGHRELPDVRKTCPGKLVSMERFRAALQDGACPTCGRPYVDP